MIAPPPLLFAGAIAIGLALHYWVIPISFGLAAGVRYGIGGVLIAVALKFGFGRYPAVWQSWHACRAVEAGDDACDLRHL